MGRTHGPDVGEANSNQLLRRIDAVVVDSTERLGNGNVLDQEHDDGDRKLVRKRDENLLVDFWDAHGLETARNGSQDRKQGLLAVVHVGEPADHGVEQNDESSSQSAQEKVESLSLGVALCQPVANKADEVWQQGVRPDVFPDGGANSQSMVNAVNPIAASSVVDPRYWKVWMMTQ
jgi:hypothetical protein